ncbi:rhomboid family intramembrane serine protease [Haliangium sp.]|uniref:rhomboid family intramembrane serine protease n=1 Tax=Haliangium sp. TaxID=2663208 RepID=UPI003D10E590
MYFDILLLSVVAVTAYLGPAILRRRPPGHRAFGWLLVADGGLAVLALVGPDGRPAELLGAVSLGAAVFLLLVPPLLRDLTRRALRADRPGLALRVIDFWRHLQPGMGLEQEREMVEILAAVKQGQVDEAVALLSQARTQAQAQPDGARVARHIDERIVAIYLTARRWADAVEAYEAGLADQPLPPQICVELMWAYCELDDLDAASGMVVRICEQAAAGDPAWVFLAHRARLVLLAYAGRAKVVAHMVGPEGVMGVLPLASRRFWYGVACLYAGERDQARAALAEARARSRRDRRDRERAEQMLERAERGEITGPPEVAEETATVLDRCCVTALMAPASRFRVMPRLTDVPAREVPVTVAFAALNLVAAAAVYLVFGTSGDPGALVLAGANLKAWVVHGDYARLPSSMFLHVGAVHLALNVYGLWILGKLVEQIHGPLRTVVIYVFAGLAGAAASARLGAPGISAGASGAVLGLLSALIAELWLHKDAYPKRWRSALLPPLLFVALAQVLIGFFYEAIDQWAHVVGLGAGALASVALSRRWAWAESRPMRAVVVALAAAAGLALGYGAYGVATASPGQTLVAGPWAGYRLGALAFDGPVVLGLEDSGRALSDGGVLGLRAVVACPRPTPPNRSELCIEGGDGAAHLTHAVEVARASWLDVGAHVDVVAGADADADAGPGAPAWVPAHWQVERLSVRMDGLGGEEYYRVVVAVRQLPEAVWVVLAQVPERLATDLELVVGAMLASMRPAEADASAEAP